VVGSWSTQHGFFPSDVSLGDFSAVREPPTINGMRMVGLYGGSFDPVHLGHLLVAQAALEELCLDRLLFIPAAQSPFKPTAPRTPTSLRLRMLRLALAGQERIEVDDREIRRGGIGYTIDTVRELARESPESRWFWLIGADHVAQLPKWREAQELAQRIEFVVIPRPDEAVSPLAPPWRLHFLRGWPLKLSSSEIRARVLSRKSILHLVPAAVAEVIDLQGLYQT